MHDRPQIPLVDYLDLDGAPALVAHRCADCGARFFDRRNACASCGGVRFDRVRLARTGAVTSFTIVHRATPDITVPYTSVVVRLDDGKAVKANLIGVEPEPSALRPGLRVELAVWSAGTDSEGTEALTFGFRPLDTPEPGASA